MRSGDHTGTFSRSSGCVCTGSIPDGYPLDFLLNSENRRTYRQPLVDARDRWAPRARALCSTNIETLLWLDKPGDDVTQPVRWGHCKYLFIYLSIYLFIHLSEFATDLFFGGRTWYKSRFKGTKSCWSWINFVLLSFENAQITHTYFSLFESLWFIIYSLFLDL